MTTTFFNRDSPHRWQRVGCFCFDTGELSGWMYKANGWFPNYGCSRYQLQPGDVIERLYTCDLVAWTDHEGETWAKTHWVANWKTSPVFTVGHLDKDRRNIVYMVYYYNQRSVDGKSCVWERR